MLYIELTQMFKEYTLYLNILVITYNKRRREGRGKVKEGGGEEGGGK